MAKKLENKCKYCLYCVNFMQLNDYRNVISICCCPQEEDFDTEGGQIMYEISLFDSSRCSLYENLSEACNETTKKN